MNRIHRALAVLAAAVLLAALFVTDHFAPDRAAPATAVSGSDFTPGMLITDSLFFDGDAMTVAEVQRFLDEKGRNCGSNCLKNFAQATRSQPATSRCDGYTGRSRESAAEIIVNVANSCGISPKVLLVMLEKETSLVTMNGPGDWRYERAMGYYCPDDPSRPGWCHPDYGGFFNQLYNAAAQMQRYVQNPYDYGYVAGRYNNIQYNPNLSCGTQRVYIENSATAALYIYTPYVPNRAALANLYGTGDGCSAYGNRNFWRLYNDWFGPTTGSADDSSSKRSPYGTIDSATGGNGTIRLTGWGIDPDDMTQSLYVWVTIDGVGKHIRANAPRPDVQRALPGAGPNQGFATTLTAEPGTREVCATLHNIGPGAHTSLGCRTVTVTGGTTGGVDPIGTITSLSTTPGVINVRGWAYEPDNPSNPVYVYVTVDGKGGHIRANQYRSEVAERYPEYGTHRGYQSSYKVSAGEHRVCVTLHNTGSGSHRSLGCRTIQVAAGTNFAPQGRLDGVTAIAGGVRVNGWAFDADTPTSAQVVLTANGQSTTVRTGTSRPDVARVIDPRAEAAGFSSALSLRPGTHRVCAEVIDSGTTNRKSIGCRTVTVPGDDPIGSIDRISTITGGVRISGWAADLDAPDQHVYVWVTVNGEGRHIKANLSRPDVQRVYPALTDRHGYSVDLRLPAGDNRVCLTAHNIGPGSHKSFGCHVIRR